MDKHNYSTTTHKKPVQKSTTLNRKFVKKMDIAPRRPMRRGYVAPIATKPVAKPQATPLKPNQVAVRTAPKAVAAPIADKPATVHPIAKTANTRVAMSAVAPRPLSAQELKTRAIEKALASAESMAVEEGTVAVKRHFWQSKKFFLALGMSVASIALLGYLIHLNLPDLSVRVAAMQTGVDGTYPSYVPRGYVLEGAVSSHADNKISMTFENSDKKFTLTQEKSSWDSAALLTNYVKKEWKNQYVTTDEQGLRIFINGSDAAWVSGGIFYLITSSPEGSLTKQQIHDIAISL